MSCDDVYVIIFILFILLLINVRSLTLLWKTMILTKLMYAAPIWIHLQGYVAKFLLENNWSHAQPKPMLI